MKSEQKFFENFLEKRKPGADKIKKVYGNLSLLERRYNLAITECRSKGKKFNLSFEDFCSAIDSECIYCDGYFGKTVFGIGLDRLDNTKGYEVGNIVSCCYNCNRVRGHIFSPEETKAMIRLVIRSRQNEVIKIAHG